MRTRFSLLLATGIAVAVAAGAGGARAERTPDRIELGGFAGAHLLGDGGMAPADSLALGVRGGWIWRHGVTFEAEVVFAPSSTRSGDMDLLAIGWRGHALYHVRVPALARRSLVPYVSLGAGGVTTSFASAETERDAVRVPLGSSDTDVVLDAGLGLKFVALGPVVLRFDARWMVAPGDDAFGTARLEVLLGAYTRFGGRTVVRHVPQPPLATDPDHDLWYGDADKCPEEPEDDDLFEDEDGCPDLDNDGDTVNDTDDGCPDVAEDANGIDDGDGCPDPDDDSDGLLGSADQCPNEAEDADGTTDEDGCPDLDDDADGINEPDDECPYTAENVNGYEDQNGCPDEIPRELVKAMGVVKGVTFKKGDATLSKKAKKALDKVAKLLAKYPGAPIEVSAHTTAKGDHDALVELSALRAEAVRAYLVEKGIDESRLYAVGHGPDRPLKKGKREKPVERLELRIVVPE